MSSKFRARALGALIAFLALINALSSLLGNDPHSLPSNLYIAFKLVLFLTLIGCIGLLGSPVHGAPLKARRPDGLLILRAYACVLVLLGHYFFIVFPYQNYIGSFSTHPLTRLLSASPWGGIWIFFVLSGYLMGKGFYSDRYDASPGGLSNYFRNRALRIIPVYAFAVLACALILTPQIFRPGNLWILSEYFTFDYKGTTPIYPIGAAWTVSTEVQFYFLAPFMSLAIRRLTGRQALALIILFPIAMIFTLRAIDPAWAAYVYTPMLSNIGYFSAGIALNNIIAHARRSPPMLTRQSATFIALVAMIVFYIFISVLGSFTAFTGVRHGYFTYTPLLTLWFTACIIFLFERHDGTLSPILAASLSRMEIFGSLTYCIYMVHEPIYIFLRAQFAATLTLGTSLVLFPVVATATLLVAYLLYRLIEKPFDRLRFGHGRPDETALGVMRH